jgi:hypothetical protein
MFTESGQEPETYPGTAANTDDQSMKVRFQADGV